MAFGDDGRPVFDIRLARLQPAPELEDVRLEGLDEVR